MSIKAIVYTCANCGAEFRTDGPKDKIRNLALVDTIAADPDLRLCALFVSWTPDTVDRYVGGAFIQEDWLRNTALAALCPGCAEAVYRALSAQRSGPPLAWTPGEYRKPMNAEWTAADVAAYEAFLAQHREEVQLCTCAGEYNHHVADCAYRMSMDRIDAAWKAQYTREVPHD
jgi:hypothetical protein